MIECPKCGSTNISGPRYCKGGLLCQHHASGEHLAYRCCRCGYTDTRPTRDKRP